MRDKRDGRNDLRPISNSTENPLESARAGIKIPQRFAAQLFIEAAREDDIERLFEILERVEMGQVERGAELRRAALWVERFSRVQSILGEGRYSWLTHQLDNVFLFRENEVPADHERDQGSSFRPPASWLGLDGEYFKALECLERAGYLTHHLDNFEGKLWLRQERAKLGVIGQFVSEKNVQEENAAQRAVEFVRHFGGQANSFVDKIALLGTQRKNLEKLPLLYASATLCEAEISPNDLLNNTIAPEFVDRIIQARIPELIEEFWQTDMDLCLQTLSPTLKCSDTILNTLNVLSFSQKGQR